MKIIMVLMALALILVGNSNDIMFIPIGSSNGTGTICPPDTVCYDVSQQIGQYFTYNVSSSLDEPYTFDARG